MDRRERFLAEMRENALLPYEACHVYEEELAGELENRFEAEYLERFLTLIGQDAFVLDLACGDGRHTLRLAARAMRVVGMDVSPNGLQMARKKCAGRENIAFLSGSMLEDPFHERAFDGVWFSQAFEYVAPDRREMFLHSLSQTLRPAGLLYMSVETWMYPGLWKSLKELWRDFRLFCYWRFLRGKPLRWGEFLYYLPPSDTWSWCPGWHYHVHTDLWTLRRLLGRSGFAVEQMDLYGGYVYVLCRPAQ